VADRYDRNLGFLDRSRHYFFQVLLSCTHEAGWTPFQTHSSEIGSVVFLGIASAAFLMSEPHGTQEHILLSLFLRPLQPGGPGSSIYFPKEQGTPVVPLGIGFV
jgi:hypothetical protein